MESTWDFDWELMGPSLAFHWECIGNALGMHWDCIGIALGQVRKQYRRNQAAISAAG
jgi:hypothetical protein